MHEWIHTLWYEIYLKNIMHKKWKLEIKLKKTRFGYLSNEKSERDFNGMEIDNEDMHYDMEYIWEI